MKHCQNCGVIAQNENQQHCQNCGHPFVQTPAYQHHNMNQPYQQQNTYQQQNMNRPYQQQNAYQQQNMNRPYQQQNAYQQQNMNRPYQQQNAYQQQNINQPYTQQNTYPTPSYATVQPVLPMKWYKALIYVILFLSMILSAGNAMMLFNGTTYKQQARMLLVEQYEENIDYAQRFYDYYGSNVKTVDMLYAACGIISAVFAIFVRQLLAKYKSNAPKMLIFLYVYNLIVDLIYIIAIYSIISNVDPSIKFENIFSESLGSSIAISLAMISANITYFKKRQHLFVN